MYRTNPTGRVPRTSKRPDPIRVGEGTCVHQRGPKGFPLCMPSKNATSEKRVAPGKGNTVLTNITPAKGQQITCMRCAKLMAIDNQLSGDDLVRGKTSALDKLLRQARASRSS